MLLPGARGLLGHEVQIPAGTITNPKTGRSCDVLRVSHLSYMHAACTISCQDTE